MFKIFTLVCFLTPNYGNFYQHCIDHGVAEAFPTFKSQAECENWINTKLIPVEKWTGSIVTGYMTTEIDGIQTNYRCLTLLSKSSKEKTNESQNPRAAAGFTAYDLSRLCSAPFSHSDRGLVDGLPCIRFLNKIAEPAVRAHRICPPHGTTNGNLVTAWEVYFMREGDPSQSAEAEAEAAFASAFPCHGGGR